MRKVFYPPAEGASSAKVYFGLVLRTLVTYAGIIGLTALVCGAAGLTVSDWWGGVVVSAGSIALLSLPAAIACGVASTGRIAAIVTPFAYTGIYAAVVSAMYGNPVNFTVYSVLRVYNSTLYCLSARGFSSLGNYMVSDGFDYSQLGSMSSDPYRFGGAFVLATLFGIFLYLTVQKKVRLIPFTLGVAAVLAPILTYNSAHGNAGIGFTVCLVCGALGMKFYDRAYSGKIEKRHTKQSDRKLRRKQSAEKRAALRKEKAERKNLADRVFETAKLRFGKDRAIAARRAVILTQKDQKKASEKEEKARRREEKKAAKKLARESAPDKAHAKEARKRRQRISHMGGYTGAACAALMLLALWIPMATVKGNFKVIDSINNKVQIIRTYVTAYLQGNDVDLNQLYAYDIDDLAPRKLSFEPLSFKDRRLFRVESETENNIYLRSWIGTNFDYTAEEWTSADTDRVLAYRNTFGDTFTPDEITHNFYKYIYPSCTDLDSEKPYIDFSKDGFAVQKVNVWRVSGKSRLLFVPAHMDTETGLTGYGTEEEPPYKYSKYFDGVYSSRFYKYGSGYGSVSYITAFNNAASGKGLDGSVEYWRLARDFILSNCEKELSSEEKDALLSAFEAQMSKAGLKYTGVSLPERFFTQMSEDEKESLLSYFEKEESYKSYALENYTEKSSSETVAEIAADIKAAALENDADGVLSENEAAMAVVDYFRNNFTYTETPDGKGYNGEKTVLEAFLTDVKEGYCTHFATAAAAILREYGFPVRYAEGLVAHEFSQVRAAVSPYRSYVEDNDASAWIEVYTDGIGWVQYEVTPGELCEGMYDERIPEDDSDGENHADGEGKNPFGEEEKRETAWEILNRLGLTTPKEPGESDVQWFLRRAVPFVILLLVIAVAALLIRFFVNRVQKTLGERYAVIEKVQNPKNEKEPDEDFAALTRQIDGMIIEVFELIGEGPEKGELPSCFAERIAKDHGELSTIDPREVFAYMEKAEFGHGIGYREADICAEYLKDIKGGVYERLKPFEKFKLRYIKRKL